MLCVSDINKQSHMLRTIRFGKVIGWRKKIKENVSRPVELGRKTNEYEIYSLFRLEIHHNNQSELNDIWCHVLFGRAFYLWWCAERFALHTQSPGTCKHFFQWFRFETRAELIKNCWWNLNTQPNSLLGCVFFFWQMYYVSKSSDQEWNAMLLLCPMECPAVYKCIPPRSEPRNRLDEYSSLEMLLQSWVQRFYVKHGNAKFGAELNSRWHIAGMWFLFHDARYWIIMLAWCHWHLFLRKENKMSVAKKVPMRKQYARHRTKKAERERDSKEARI